MNINNIRKELLTKKGTIPLFPDYGSNLHKFAEHPNDEVLRSLISVEISIVVSRHVTADSIKVEFSENSISIIINQNYNINI